ncbi:MAG: acetylxylan esterase [Akkermansiaceae bacterium]
MFKKFSSPVLVTLFGALSLHGAEKDFIPNYDEAKVPAYTLPDPLAPAGGPAVTDRASWESGGRPRTLSLFEDHIHGREPADFQPKLEWKLDREDGDALDGTAIRREYLITIGGKVPVRMLLYLPKNTTGPVPAFLGLNFQGNQRVEADPWITMETGYVIGNDDPEVKGNRPTEASRGTSAGRWPAKLIIGRGYALATACCGNFDPDFDDGFRNGVHALDTTPRTAESWGTISTWAWGLSRLREVLEKIDEVDGGRVAVIGHSRLGKAALWAGARDPRFAMVVSNNSGCGGAALSRRAYGETVGRINGNFPHWFAGAFKPYSENESALPVDQHQLIGLIAPRPVYVASATDDRWADPRGEFLALQQAEIIYQLYQKNPFGGVTEAPPPGKRVGHLMGYHLREGPHEITPEDWGHYLDFADQWLVKKTTDDKLKP